MNTTMPISDHSVARSPARQAGFTLIEMMISVTIGLGLLAGLVGVLATSSSNSRSNDKTSELMTNGRYALNSIKQELREAGFRGYTWAEPDTVAPGALGALGNECRQGVNVSGSFISNTRQGIWGFNDANPFDAASAGNCITQYLAGNDVLVVRRLAPFPATALVANTVYFQSTYARGQVFRGAVAPVFGGAPTPLASFAVQVYVYYISPVTNTTTPEVPAVPSLRRVALSSTGAMVDELVASGIEHLQVQFGHLATNGATQYLNAQTAPLDSDSSNALSAVWDDVNSVRIWLLARNTLAEPGYANTQTYTMGGQDFVKNDGFRRQVFTTVVQLRN